MPARASASEALNAGAPSANAGLRAEEPVRESVYLLRASHSGIFWRLLNSHGNRHARVTIANPSAGSGWGLAEGQARKGEAQGCAEQFCTLCHALATAQNSRTGS
jgi:hypothetical protein